MEITVVNHLDQPTTVHWHGLELDSYYDGVVGGGDGNQITPAILPGGSFVARFTPNRAGTFIYHTHAADPNQLSGGVYGGLIVLEPGQSYDAEHDRLLIIGARDNDFRTSRITLNGSETLSPIVFTHGERYRLRVINIAPNLGANFQLGGRSIQRRGSPSRRTEPPFPREWQSRRVRCCILCRAKRTISNSTRKRRVKSPCRSRTI